MPYSRHHHHHRRRRHRHRHRRRHRHHHRRRCRVVSSSLSSVVVDLRTGLQSYSK